jgi:hypothetical protein
MPVRNKTYSLQTTPAGGSIRPLPEAPARASLLIQNTGGVPGRVRFGGACQGAGADITWAPGLLILWKEADTCPLDSVNLASDVATTWLVMEGIRIG